ncbi:MAG: hypothetical protein M1528_02125 [Candidatus Marsarchaeota archaeon]|jgi:hypothetical protein|nr:hypothetical protein [Candidatus Marsarchaeota archaeon]MCL5115306.1 hypothetical protein [Candidatus Marsarchaeota archaeon]
MEKDKRKRLLFLIATVALAVMFVTSYAAFGSGSSISTSSTTINQQTIAVFGTSNAVVAGYGSSITLSIINSSIGGKVNSTIAALYSNGSIANYVQLPNGFTLYMANMSAYGLQELFSSTLPRNSVRINASETVKLPPSIKMYYNGNPIFVRSSILNFSLQRSPLLQEGSTVSVNVQALVLLNGSVYNGNIRVS